MERTFDSVAKLHNIEKSYTNFTLSLPELCIPKGFSTALIGENGAGKTTLLKILTGLNDEYSGDIEYFEGLREKHLIIDRIGYTSSTNYFNPSWKLENISEFSPYIYDSFNSDTFYKILNETDMINVKQSISQMSDGMKMKTMIAATLARKTEFLIMDEPASPLDPIMREKLCDLIRAYIRQGNGSNSVLFSTHNISDMENVTDYAIFMAGGMVVEQGFVEDLKEKYYLIKGEPSHAKILKEFLIGFTENPYNCQGLCLIDDLDKLAGMDVTVETPTLNQISVGIMKGGAK